MIKYQKKDINLVIRIDDQLYIDLVEVSSALRMNISQLVRYILNHQLEYIKKRDKLTTFVDLFPDDFKHTR